LRSLGERSLPEPGRRTFGDLLRAFLDSADLRPRTRQDYEDTARRYLGPLMGCRIARLDPVTILEVLRPLRDKPRTCLKVFRLLHRALGFAVRCGYLASNPAASIEPPRYRPARKVVWNPEELGRFLEAARDHRLGPLFWLLAATGMRLSEALAIRWCDLDLRAGTVRVERGAHRIKGQWLFTEPKSRNSLRAISLPPSVVEVLKRARRQAVEEGLRSGRGLEEDQLVFCGRNGLPLHQRYVQRTLKQLAQRAGVPPVTPHSLRHGHASMLLAQGAPLPEVSARLGHASPSITASVYAHSLNQDRTLAALMERALQEVRP
jgi:integrase